MANSHPVVVLIGPPASGKTKIGKRIARLLDTNHIDTDAVVVSRHGAIPEIFAGVGEAAFRGFEREAVVEALATNAVVSLGGGALTHPDTLSDLSHHIVVGLTISAEAVAHRLNNNKRPLLANGVADWEKLVAKRQPLYDQVARLTIDVSHRPAIDVAEQIVSWLRERSPTS